MRLKIVSVVALCGALISATAFTQTIEGGSSGISLSSVISGITGVFAKLDLTNTFTEKQTIDFADSTSNIYNGLKITNDQYPAICLGPTTAWNRQACFSSGPTLKLHGLGGTLYDTTTTGNKALEYDVQNRRLWLANNGVTNIGNTSTSASETTLTVGGNSRTTATFLVDATNDWTKQIKITAPAASECDAEDEGGRLFFDDTSEGYRFCHGTVQPQWTNSVQHFFRRFDTSAANTNVWQDENITLRWSGGTGKDPELSIGQFGAGGFITYSCFDDGGMTSASVNTAGPHDIYTAGLLSSGDQVRCAITANDDSAYPQYNLVWFNADNSGETTLTVEKVWP